MARISSLLQGVYLVPGLPHILQKAEMNAGYQQLKAAAEQCGASIVANSCERIVFVSTAWISVLGQLVQSRVHVAGSHVDENWYEYGALNFEFKTDTNFAAAIKSKWDECGYPTKLVDYAHFPIDTGTIVAQQLVNPNKLRTTMLALNIYNNVQQTKALFAGVRKAIEADQVKTAVVIVSGLSQAFYATPIDLREDGYSSTQIRDLDLHMLAYLDSGRYGDAESWCPEYAARAKADQGFKALAVIRGLLGDTYAEPAQVKATGPIYGSGAAVIEFLVSN